MNAYYLPNRVRVDVDGVVNAILAQEEWPQAYLDTETGALAYVVSPKALGDWVEKIKNSQRYFLVERLTDEDRNSIAKEFVSELFTDIASREDVDGSREALQSGNWRTMEIFLKEQTDGWIHAWDQYVSDEAWDYADAWLTGNPHVAITTEFEGCENCAVCEVMRRGEDGDMSKLMQAFNTETIMSNVQTQLESRSTAHIPKVQTTKKTRTVSDKSKKSSATQN